MLGLVERELRGFETALRLLLELILRLELVLLGLTTYTEVELVLIIRLALVLPKVI